MRVRAVKLDNRGCGGWLQESGRVVAAALVLGALSLFALAPFCASAVAATPLEYVEEFGPDGGPATSFAGAGPIAVDQNSDVIYVIDEPAGSIYKFDLDGNPVPFGGSAPDLLGNRLSGLTFPAEYAKGQVAVDSRSDVIYVTETDRIRAFQGNGEPFEFTAGPNPGSNEIGGFTELGGVAVDIAGNIYATDDRTLRVYRPSGEPLTSLEVEEGFDLANLAVAASGDVFILKWTYDLIKVTPSQFPPTPGTTFVPQKIQFDPPDIFEPPHPTSVAVNPLTSEVYSADESPISRVTRYDRNGAYLDAFAGPGQEGEVGLAKGVAVHGRTGKVFVADGSDPSRVEIFQPRPAAPTIESRFASEVGSDSATLGARVNPNTLETTVTFEYGLGQCSSGTCTALVSTKIGAGYTAARIDTQPILGLLPRTTYHYRVVASNSRGATEEVGTFTTQGSSLGFALPDSRIWELVSPPNKHGARLENPANGPMMAAADGNGLAYQSALSIEPEPDGSRAPERSIVLARRLGSSWHSEDITPPHGEAAFISNIGNEYQGFSPDLSMALLEPRDDYPLSPAASAKTPYIRSNTDVPTYTPLVTAKEGFANVPLGTVFGETEDREVQSVGANAALTAVVVKPEFPLVPGHQAGSLYRWTHSDGQLQPISVLPLDQGASVVEASVGSGQGSNRNAVSVDGSRVFWSQGEAAVGAAASALYLRDFDANETVRLDVPRPGIVGPGLANPLFQAANRDGTVVFFTDSQQLTEGASEAGHDLYRCALPPSTSIEPLECDLTNLTSSRANPGESAEVLGLAPGGAEDGSSLYFVAQGILDEEPNQMGGTAAPGEPNLYHWQEEGGVRYVATLTEQDSGVWGAAADSSAGLAKRQTATSSPSGRYLAFMSELNLTDYESRDVASGRPTLEIYGYDAISESLTCVSCNPTGASPEGTERTGVSGRSSFVDPQGVQRDNRVAALLPQTRILDTSTQGVYRPRAVLDNGRIFFNAFDALVPADSNGQWDVYGFEPVGTGSCDALSSGAATVRSAGGCVSLLSSGTAGEEAAFLDASVSGDDVFFLTTARLSVTDVDDEYDVYDARVGGVPAELHDSTQCRGEACQPAATAPNDPTPGTATLQGPADPTVRAQRCPRGKHKVRRKGRIRCVKRKRGKSSGAGRQAVKPRGSGR
jgi:hypothetical protein